MKSGELDWMMHAPMVYEVLSDLRYLRQRGISLSFDGQVIRRSGGWGYSPSEIASFEDALTVLRDNGAACTPHFSAICLLEGVSYFSVLDDGRALLRRLFGGAS